MPEKEALQLRVGREIEESVLPYYRRLFPQSPQVHEEGRYRILPNPFYGVLNGVRLDHQTYVAKVLEGCLAARSIHGPMHATRVAFLAGLLMVFRERFTGDKARWPFELQMAAAFHDAGRQDEGPDEWELESEKIFGRWLSRTPGAQVEALGVLQFKRNKLDGCAEKDTLIDADTLDVQRVIADRARFDVRRLSFWHDRRIPTQRKQDMVNETWAFVHLTERPELKRQLEDSGAVYFHLMHLLVQAHRTASSYPLLYDLLEELAGNKAGIVNLTQDATEGSESSKENPPSSYS